MYYLVVEDRLRTEHLQRALDGGTALHLDSKVHLPADAEVSLGIGVDIGDHTMGLLIIVLSVQYSCAKSASRNSLRRSEASSP